MAHFSLRRLTNEAEIGCMQKNVSPSSGIFKACRGRLPALGTAILFVLLPGFARADLGVMLADPTTVGASALTHSGHALVYLSGVCAETAVRARLCRPEENGSVVTQYPQFRENGDYGWNIVPVELYLEGSVRPGERMLYGSRSVKDTLAAKAKDGFFDEVCSGACPQYAHSYWKDLVGATISRDVFVYAVKTTPEQDTATVAWLNRRENVDDYNGITNNCAVFSRDLINSVFPHSVHRDVLNDLGMMSPKSAARSFTRWARRQPALGFYAMHFSQKPGSVPRSGTASSGTETAIHMKKYLIAAALIGDHEVAGSFFVAYFLTGRFGQYKEYVRHSTPSLTELEMKRRSQNEQGDAAGLRETKAEISTQRAETTGTKEEWISYRQRFAAMCEELPGCREDLKTVVKRLDGGTVSVDGNGDAWVVPGGDSRRVGISNRNVVGEGSDPDLALQLMAWRVGFALKAKARMRPGIAEFREEWSLLEQAYTRLHPTLIVARGEGASDKTAVSNYVSSAR
jgi:hypothetical protein